MNDYIFVIFTILIIAGLISCVYIIMLDSKKKEENSDLQITSNDILQQLNILYKQKNYNIVESLAKNYLAKKSHDDDVRTILAKTLYDSGKLSEAMEQAKLIIKNQPDNFKMKIFLANCFLETNKVMKAIALFEEILKNDSGNVVAIKELAKVYLDTNQKKSAIKMYKKLEEYLESNQEKIKTKDIVAKIHVEFEEYDSAIKEYEQILEIYPDDINTKKCLIDLYKKTYENDSIIKLANEIRLVNPDTEDELWALQTLLDVYQTMQNYEKALEIANLIKIHPLSNNLQSDENIAMILFGEGKMEEAIELLKSLVAEAPDNIELKKELAKAYETNKDFFSAVELYKIIIDMVKAKEINEIHFELSNIYNNWAMYAFSQNETEDCFKYFTEAIKYYPENPDIYYHLGNVNQLIKNFNEAISQYKKAIDIDSGNYSYYLAIAECYEAIESIYEQRNALIESLKYNPDNAQAHYKLAIIYDLQKDNSDAMLHIQKAIKLDEKFINAKYKMALMLECAGNNEGAKKIYEDILNIDPEHKEALNNIRMLS